MNKFEKWFKAQFGGLPNLTKANRLKTQKRNLLQQLAVIDLELENLNKLQVSYTAARYAAYSESNRPKERQK